VPQYPQPDAEPNRRRTKTAIHPIPAGFRVDGHLAMMLEHDLAADLQAQPQAIGLVVT
jgi:hypothetical protein